MRRFLAVVFVAALAFASASCGKSSSSINPAAAEAAANAGDAALANGDVAAANAHYKDALGKDPSNSHANLGAAVTETALLQEDAGVDSLLTFLGDIPLPVAAARPGIARPSRMLSTLGMTPRLGFDPLSNGRGLAKLFILTAQDPALLSWFQAVVLNRILPRLQYAEDRLAVIETHPNFTYIVPPDVSGAPSPYEVDLGEVLALDAMINSIQGVLGVLVAYNFDTPAGKTQEELLAPASAFGTLWAGGAARLAAARLNLLNAHTRFLAMAAFITAETDDQTDDVIPKAALDTPEFLDLQTGFDDVHTALTSTVTVTGVEAYDLTLHDVDLAVSAFFTNPIADFKTKLPPLTFDVTTGDPMTSDPITFPDPAFNGIFPTMTNAKWYELIGPLNPPPARPRL